MTIGEKIFEMLKTKGMTQKELSKLTGIAESSISDWKRKKTNPSSQNILKISKALGIAPDELLSGTMSEGVKSRPEDYIIITPDSEVGRLVECYNGLGASNKERLADYLQMLLKLESENK